MPKKSEIPSRNRNHTGWWIFGEVLQWVSKTQKRLTPKSRCLVYENFRLICAKSREEAHRKAIKLGNQGHPSKTDGGEWRFAGISMLLPLYDEIEDGAEILWNDRSLMTVSKLKRLVKSKRRLSVFDDTENG